MGQPTIFEHGLSEYLDRNVRSGRLRFTTDIPAALHDSDVLFIAAGTPEAGDGSGDLSQVRAIINDVAAHCTGFTVLVMKSTVPSGRTDGLPTSLPQALMTARSWPW